MSYLVLPALVETGFFAEAAKQMHAVCNFHIVGKYEVYTVCTCVYGAAFVSRTVAGCIVGQCNLVRVCVCVFVRVHEDLTL